MGMAVILPVDASTREVLPLSNLNKLGDVLMQDLVVLANQRDYGSRHILQHEVLDLYGEFGV